MAAVPDDTPGMFYSGGCALVVVIVALVSIWYVLEMTGVLDEVREWWRRRHGGRP